MFFEIIIALISFSGLLFLHEFGHFILAKKLGMEVEEFGLGYPPRLFGKKFGKTLYSLNLLPFGAFVKVPPQEHSARKIWKEILVAGGGVISFWIISVLLLSIVMGLGIEMIIDDKQNTGFVNPKVQILAQSLDSPAAKAGLAIGDIIKEFSIFNSFAPGEETLGPAEHLQFSITKVGEVQELTKKYKGKEITLTIERLQPSRRPPAEGGSLGKEIFEVTLVPRFSPPEGEGPIGVALVRTAFKRYPFYEAPFRGVIATFNLTSGVINGWAQALKNLFLGLPIGVQVMGPIGMVDLFAKAAKLGISYYLQFIAMISVYLALFNILPIPVADGGRLLFLGIEAIRKKPIPQKIDKSMTAFFFSLLILLSFWIAIKDIMRIF